MYNEDIKNRFIEEKNKTTILPDKVLERLFDKTEKFENEYSKDICNFTVFEIREFYKSLCVSSEASLTMTNSYLTMYTMWCLNENLVKDNQNHFAEFGLEEILNCLNKVKEKAKIVSRETIISWCNKLPNARDKYVLLGIFEGLKSKNFKGIIDLRYEDVTGNQLKLSDGRVINVSDDLIRYIEMCKTETHYQGLNDVSGKVSALIDEGYVLKRFVNSKQRPTYDLIWTQLKRILKFVEAYHGITIMDIQNSGKIDMIKRRSKELNMTPKEYIKSPCIEEVENQFDTSIMAKRFFEKYRDYLK